MHYQFYLSSYYQFSFYTLNSMECFFGCMYSKLVLINSKNGKKFLRFFKKSKGLEGQFCKKIDLKSRYHQIQVAPLDGIHE